jgi:hypothetical protein
MGWNSWDCYGTTVTEAEVLANAHFMADNLLRFGWDTVVVDIDWSDPTAKAHGYNLDPPLVMDGHGRLMPDPGRFPSAADGSGFTSLASHIHDLGLKFGIHTMRGIPRRAVASDLPVLGTDATAAQIAAIHDLCPWNSDMVGVDMSHPAGQAYYDSTLALYAAWGVDYLKTDDMLAPYHSAEIEALSLGVARCGRPITVSLSPGTALSLAHVDHLRGSADLWRICDDVWDRWEDIRANVDRLARWAPYGGPEGWPDADMLPLGHISIRGERGEDRIDHLTSTERVTMMTLWAIGRSPLMIGGDLPTTPGDTIALFQNPEVIALNQRGASTRQLVRESDLVIWGASLDGCPVTAIINLGDDAMIQDLDLTDLSMSPGPEIRDLWSGQPVMSSLDQRGRPILSCQIPTHGSLLLRQGR